MDVAKHKDFLILILFILLFIGIRSIHFSSYLNFSSDQAMFSTKALEIYKNKRITLIGPPTSINIQGRVIFQGSVIYYFLLLFLKLGNFDPIVSSYIFMVFCSLMIIPLYYGMKKLTNKNITLITIIIYTLLPFYINYTRFLWNPNFQFSFIPIFIFFLALALTNKKQQTLFLLILGILGGILTLFHFQFFLILVICFLYLIIKRTSWKNLLIFSLGIILGFSPLILFELRNNFYNTRTILFFLKNKHTNTILNIQGHYFLSLSFIVIVLLLTSIKRKISPIIVSVLFFTLLFISLIIYIPKPSHGFGMVKNWNYLNEIKAHQIIKDQNLDNYNIINLIYDTKANVQKYLLKKDGINDDFTDYYTNQYLFVLNEDDNFQNDPAYEIRNFKPNKVEKRWPINSFYQLYLLKRLK